MLPGAFITDVGRVLIDYDWRIFIKNIWPRIGNLNKHADVSAIRLKETQIVDAFARGEMSGPIFYQEYLAVFGVTETILPYEKFIEEYNSIFTGEIREVVDLLDMIKKEFGCMIIITNNNKFHFDFAIKNHGHIFKKFDLVIASQKVKALKPERKIYELAISFIKEKGLDPKQSLFVDDFAKNLQGAVDAGIGNTFLFDPKKNGEFTDFMKTKYKIIRG